MARDEADVVGEGERRVNNVLVEKVDIIAVWIGGIVIEGEVARQYCVENYAAGPGAR